jgi:ubiquinone/menaquinone biosynthesis C-methylase UbiE
VRRRDPAERMGAAWDRFARRAPLDFIDPALGRGVEQEEFVAAGRANVDRVMDWVGDDVSRERMLELGCGVGRTTVHFAEHFKRVDGVDISSEMVGLARAGGLPPNVTLTVTTGRDLAGFADASFDVVFSHLVLQHLADETVLAANLREVARVIRPDGLALLQFDTRRRQLLATATGLLPDALLPARLRRHARRYPRRATRVRELATAAGLTLDHEQDPGTANHWLFLRPT